jgi:hypothetical protein
MKPVFALAALALALAAPLLAAHAHPARHGMLLFGEKAVFASHIVNRVPHNYQVVLQVWLAPAARAAYDRARAEYPGQSLVLALDHLEIGNLETGKPELGGDLVRVTPEGERIPFHSGVRLSPWDYERIFFQELPLDLSGDGHRADHILCWSHSDCPRGMSCSGGTSWGDIPGFCRKR